MSLGDDIEDLIRLQKQQNQKLDEIITLLQEVVGYYGSSAYIKTSRDM